MAKSYFCKVAVKSAAERPEWLTFLTNSPTVGAPAASKIWVVMESLRSVSTTGVHLYGVLESVSSNHLSIRVTVLFHVIVFSLPEGLGG